MTRPKETPPAGTEGDEENHVESGELIADAQDAHAAIRPQQPFPMTRPPGLVGDIADYIYASAPRQMIEAAVLTGLGLVAGIAGRHFNVYGSGLNIYLMLLGRTGRGKNAMAKGIRRILNVARDSVPMIDDFIGPDSFTAGASLHRYVSEHPNVLLLFGEYGQHLKQITDPRAHPNDQQMLRLMQSLYSASGAADFLPARIYSDRQMTIPVVHSPAVSILCESQPSTIYNILSQEQVGNGVVPRFLILECTTKRPPRNPEMNKAPPPELITRICDLAAVALTLRAPMDGSTSKFVDIAIETSAKAQLDAIDQEFDELYNNNDQAGQSSEADLWNRGWENVCRVAGILAVGVNMHNPVITTEHVTWAYNFVRYSITGLIARFASGDVGPPVLRQDAEMKKYIAAYMVMKPATRRNSYGVQKKIADNSTIITHRYLRQRAMRQGAFTQDPRGFEAAFNASITALIKDGVLYRINEDRAQLDYGLRCQLYGITGPSRVVVVPGVGYREEEDVDSFKAGLGLPR